MRRLLLLPLQSTMLLLCMVSVSSVAGQETPDSIADSVSLSKFQRTAHHTNSYSEEGDVDFEFEGILYRIISSTEVAVAVGDYNYDGQLSISDASLAANHGVMGNVIIPERVSYQGRSYLVTAIDWAAFPGVGYTITSITLPSSIRTIAENGFGLGLSNQIKLEYIICHSTVPPSADDAFNYSASVLDETVLYVPGSSINDYKNANGWKRFNSIKSIDDFVDNRDFFVVDGIAYEKLSAGSVSLTYSTVPYTGSIEIPSQVTEEGIVYSVTSIGNAAFRYANLSHLVIPYSIDSIGEYAFINCKITSLIINDCENILKFNSPFVNSSIEYLYLGRNYSDNRNYSHNNPSFFSNNLIRIDLGDNLTTIGNSAFTGCTGLTEVTIPSSVTSIGGRAFSGCTGLKTVYFNAENCSDFNSSYYNPFYNCPIERIVIGDNVKRIPGYFAYEQTGLNEITIPNSVTSIGSNAFSGCTGLTEVTIPSSVTSVGNSAFSLCTGLTEVTIPSSVTSVGNNAFSGCTGLTGVTIGESITSIGGRAFSGCTGLTEITIPNSVTSIGDYAFSGCTWLKTVYFNAENCNNFSFYNPFYNCPIERVVIGDNAKKIPGNFAYGLTELTEITIPDSVTSIGNGAFSGCTGLKTVYFNAENCSDFVEGKYNPFYNTSLESIVIGENVKTIPSRFLEHQTDLTEITLPNSITTIGYYAFYCCTGLKSITIPESVTSLGIMFIKGCTSLKTVYYNAKNCNFRVNMSLRPFSGCSIEQIIIGENVEKIPDYFADGLTGLTEITIPNSVTSVGNSAFKGCPGLKTVYFNAENCSDFPHSYPPFSNCPIERIVIGDNVKKIPGYFAIGLSGLTDIAIPNSVTFIGDAAFCDCTGLAQINIPNSVTFIGGAAFCGCTGLAQINIPNSVTSIGKSAFESCTGLAQINIPSSITVINDNTYRGCTGLTEITIPNSVTNIGNEVFRGCSGLKTVYFNAENCGEFMHIIDGYDYFTYLFRGCPVERMVIGDNVKKIPSGLGYLLSNLSEVIIPNTVTTIGYKAFYRTNLTEVTIPSSVTTIGENAFMDCYALNTIYFFAENCEDFRSAYYHPFKNCPVKNIYLGNNIKRIPAYFACNFTELSEISIPSKVNDVGQCAFINCTSLNYLTCWPINPPSVWNSSFNQVPLGMIIFVPEVSLEKYMSTRVWNQFEIYPISSATKRLTVNLPNDVNVSDYRQMLLELYNDSKKTHFVINDKSSYIFNNIKPNSVCNVDLHNLWGDEFGKIENVEIGEEDVSVNFETLKQPQTVTLSVRTPAGQDVTELTRIAWLDESGELLKQGSQIAGLPSGRKLAYSVKLPQELAIAYSLPTNMTYTVKDGTNHVICLLAEIAQAHLSGKVKEATSNQPLYGATISATQTFAGGNTKTTTATTDNQGAYTLDALSASTTLTVSAQGYISQTMNCDDLMTGSNVTIPDVALSPITGAVVNVNLAYTPAHAEGEAAETQNWYGDYNNLDYEVYNKTAGQTITEISVQYPQIVLLEVVNDGDVLELTATSRKNSFKPVKTTVTIAEQKATATFNIKELGQVTATFNKNTNPKVTSALYDAEDKLVRTADFSGSTLTIEELPDGNYKLVSMGKSDFFNSIYDLGQFAAAGLTEGDDYVKNEVQVNSGIISQVSIDEVPFFDESKFYYTGDHTSFTVNKPNIVIGNYLTFRAQVDFKEQYQNLVTDVQLIIDLPESCPIYDNSVLVGSSVGAYTISDNKIIISLSNYEELVRLCAIPTVAGDYVPSAFVKFKFNGKTITQPIGSASYTSAGLSISLASTVNKTTIPIGGTAIGICDISIYDNDVLIGKTKSLANGFWTINCELNKPYNLSRHNIYAEVETELGIVLQTVTVSCLYDKNMVQVSKVTQYNEQRGPTPYVITFDFLNPSTSSQHYSYDMYDNHRTFSYTIEFTDNKAVDNVMLYVKTTKGHWWPLVATYDYAKNVWVTAGEFGDSQNADLPVNVAVNFDSYGESELDMSPVDDLVYDLQQTAEKEDSLFNDASELMDSLLVNYENGILSADELLERLDSIFVTLYLLDVERPDDEPFDPENDDNEERHNPSPEFENLEAQLQEPINQTIPSSSSGGWYIPPVSVTTIEPIVDENEDIHLMDGQWWADLPNSTSVTFYDGQGGRITTDMNDAIGYPENTDEAYEAWAEDLIDFMGDVFDYSNLSLSIATDIAKNELDKFERQIRIDRKLIWYDIAHNPQPHAQPINELARHFDDVNRDAEVLRRARNVTRIAKGVSTVIGGAGSAIDVVKFVGGVRDGISWNKKWKNLIEEIQQCKDPEAQSVANEAKEYQNWARSRSIRTGVLKGAGTTLGIVGTVAAPETLGASLFLNVGGLVVNQVADHWKKECKKTNNENWKTIQNKYSQLDCDPITGGSPTGGAAPVSDPMGYIYQGPDMTFCIDPSGFVYEGVPSNRLEGVTATCYYKKFVEDMYGDLHEEVVLWDAENYGQENPLITDENGYYRWDVPIGMWQVKYEKEGYETTYSDWLPVPPPQLDVNIGMVQMRQPEVIKARAYPKAVEFEFDKFMSPETLNSDNITVTVNGSPVSGTIELLNAELDDPLAITSIRRAPGTGLTFASKVRFNANSPFNTDKVTLHVKKDVKSYADLEMYEDYEAVLDVELEIQSIEADSTVNILYGDSRELTVTVLPANASRGKTLSVRSVAPMITTTDAETYTLNNNGQAIITVHGDLPGSTSLLYSIEDYDLTASTLVKVMMESQMTVATPTASIANGSVVPSGTAVYLRCATEGATIYYTLDGSCPCDNTPARKVYDGTPIIINGTTIIKAMATAPDLYDSNVATYVYHVGNGLRGDVNGDGEVNIADVNAVIDIILGGNVDDDTRARADVNEDGEINIADINVIIDIILNPSLLMSHKVNCDDKLRLENVNIKPGEVRTLQVNVDHASRYSAMQCDIVVPAGLTLIGTNATGSNVSKMGSIDETSSRALSYSPTKVPFASNGQGILTLTVQADKALEAESEIVLTNVVLADAENKAWHLADCKARVNNTSGVNDLTAVADKVWVEGHTLFIESRQEGTAQLATINGIVCDIPVKAGVNQHRLDQGIYIVVINGISHKIAIK